MADSAVVRALPVGTELNQFQIQAVLGSGGFGITYKAWDSKMQRPVAIKEFLPNIMATRESGTLRVHPIDDQQQAYRHGIEKFLGEARTLGSFSHPNIVHGYDFFEANGTAYMVMQYADGQSLDELLDAGGPLTESKLLEYLNPLLDGLGKVHSQGILHRDIKPANIYIRKDGGPLLIDFGAARHEVGKNSNSISAIVSPGYAAPEQYSTNSKFQGPWTDLYALGATLYKCVTGKKPAESPERREALEHDQTDPLTPASQVAKGYSPSLLQAIDGLLGLKAKQRPQSVTDFRALISGNAQSGNAQQASQPKPDSATRRVTDDEAGFTESNHHPKDPSGMAKKASIAVGLIALLGTGLWFIPNSDKPIEDREPVTQQTPQAQAILDRAQQQAVQRTPSAPPAEPSSIAPTTVEPSPPPEPTPPPEPVTHQLWVNTTPSDARVILPDEPAHVRYYDGIELAPENHRIKVTAKGYYPQSLQANLSYGDQTLNVALKAKPQRLPYEPEMVSIPGGSFMMGSNDGDSDEQPVHRVSIKPFKLGKYEVTWAQYQPCIDEGACPNNDGDGGDQGWGKGNRPVINVSWNDITKHYIPWLNRKTGKRYRLPTESEWEYAARAGSTTKYSWGNSKGRNNAHCQACGSQWDNRKTAPVGSFRANAFGLYDMHGNVWEWVQDCYHGAGYRGAPTNGKARTSCDTEYRVLRGGSWFNGPTNLRSANRFWLTASGRLNAFGFRLAQDL